MSTLTDITIQAQEATISAIKTAQDLTVSAVSQVAETLAAVTPDLPDLPLSDQVPSPRDVADAYFAFATAVLDANKEFVVAVAEALQPLTGKVVASN